MDQKSVKLGQTTERSKLFAPLIICSQLIMTGCVSTEDKKVVKSYQGTATWYQCCNKTASGEKFNPNKYSAAHRTLPFGTMLRLTNVGNGNSIDVIVNDRGPFVKNKEIDVSRGAAKALGFFHSGTAKLLIEVLENEREVRKTRSSKH